eukprot:4619793-Prymnesium_polylepis.1
MCVWACGRDVGRPSKRRGLFFLRVAWPQRCRGSRCYSIAFCRWRSLTLSRRVFSARFLYKQI